MYHYTGDPQYVIEVVYDYGKPKIGEWTDYFMEVNETHFLLGFQGEASFVSMARAANATNVDWLYYSQRYPWIVDLIATSSRYSPDHRIDVRYCHMGKYI